MNYDVYLWVIIITVKIVNDELVFRRTAVA